MKKYIEIQEKTNEFLLNNPQKFVKEVTDKKDEEIYSIVMSIMFIFGGDYEDYEINIHYCNHEEGCGCVIRPFVYP